MISFSKNRWLIVTIGHYITLFFAEQLNFYLSPLGIQIFILGMLISFSAMELNFRQGFLSIIPIGLHLDAKSPLPFGFALVLSITLFTVAHIIRSRIRREINSSALVASILLNLLAFSGYTFGAIRYLGSGGLHFAPLALNLFVSALVVLVFNRLYFETHYGALQLFGVNLAEEQREAR